MSDPNEQDNLTENADQQLKDAANKAHESVDHVKDARDRFRQLNEKRAVLNSENAKNAGSKAEKGVKNFSNAMRKSGKEAGKKGAKAASKEAAKTGSKAAASGASGGAAAPILLNPITWVVILIIILVFFFIALIWFLSEGGSMNLAMGYLSGTFAPIAEVISRYNLALKDFWGFDGKFGFQATKDIIVTEEQYDPEREFDVGHIEQYKVVRKLLRNAYDYCVEKDIPSVCSKKGWDKTYVNYLTEQKYPERDMDVYADANYGELMVVLDFGFDNEVSAGTSYYGTPMGITAKDTDGVKAMDKKIMEDSVDDGEMLVHMYHLTWGPEQELEMTVGEYMTMLFGGAPDLTEEETNKIIKIKYAEPTIEQYCWGTVYDMIGINPDDVVLNEDAMKYAGKQKLGLQQTRANCEDGKGEHMVIYDTLQLDKTNDGDRWTYEVDPETPSDLIEYNNIDNSAFDTSEWYIDVPYETGGASNHVGTFSGWLYLYDAPTCTATATSYCVNCPAVMRDIKKDVTEITGYDCTTASSWCGYEFGASYWARGNGMHGVFWEQGPGGSATKNGRYLVAMGPGIVYRDYWKLTNGIGMSASWYGYGSKCMDLVLKSRATGSTYFVPITCGDAKGHAYPYGMMQTGVHTPGSGSEMIYASDFKTDAAIQGLGTAADYKGVFRTYDPILVSRTSYHMRQWLTHGMIEWCYQPPSMNCSALNSEYELLGIIVY